MMMLIMICLIVLLAGGLFIAGWLYSSHQVRFRDGYDSELESDYQSMLKQFRKREEMEKENES